jgi:xanthine/uracil permease
MRTRPASIATIVVAIGLALTTIGIARVLPHTIDGVGDRSSIGADAWAHGTAVSPALVALVFLGILAAIAMRPTRGGRRAAAWLAILAGALVVTGMFEPAQRDLVLFGTFDVALTPLVDALHVALIGLVLASIGEARRSDDPARQAPGAEREPGAASAGASFGATAVLAV